MHPPVPPSLHLYDLGLSRRSCRPSLTLSASLTLGAVSPRRPPGSTMPLPSARALRPFLALFTLESLGPLQSWLTLLDLLV